MSEETKTEQPEINEEVKKYIDKQIASLRIELMGLNAVNFNQINEVAKMFGKNATPVELV